jgi:hypothetical protein
MWYASGSDAIPAQNFSDDRPDVGEVGEVLEIWEPIVADYGVNLSLSLPLNL